MGRRDRLKNAKVIHDYDPFDNDPKKIKEKKDSPDDMTESGILKFLTGKDGQVEKIPSTGKDEDELYVLKSQIVPPVCPKCPDSSTWPRQKPCPACPPCARCPEPAFECKKVPNYSAISASNAGGILPLPRLNSFAQFN